MIGIPRDVYEHSDDPRTLIPAGKHLVEITGVTEADDYIVLRYNVLAPHGGMGGEERFYTTPKAVKRLGSLLKRLGMMERGDQGDATAYFDPQDLAGTVLVVEIVHEEVEGKRESYTVSRWGFAGFWPESHPDVRQFMAAVSRGPRPAQAQAAPITDDEV